METLKSISWVCLGVCIGLGIFASCVQGDGTVLAIALPIATYFGIDFVIRKCIN